jgi:hypothetical protein
MQERAKPLEKRISEFWEKFAEEAKERNLIP